MKPTQSKSEDQKAARQDRYKKRSQQQYTVIKCKESTISKKTDFNVRNDINEDNDMVLLDDHENVHEQESHKKVCKPHVSVKSPCNTDYHSVNKPPGPLTSSEKKALWMSKIKVKEKMKINKVKTGSPCATVSEPALQSSVKNKGQGKNRVPVIKKTKEGVFSGTIDRREGDVVPKRDSPTIDASMVGHSEVNSDAPPHTTKEGPIVHTHECDMVGKGDSSTVDGSVVQDSESSSTTKRTWVCRINLTPTKKKKKEKIKPKTGN